MHPQKQASQNSGYRRVENNYIASKLIDPETKLTRARN
jgi:hypothetical protein